MTAANAIKTVSNPEAGGVSIWEYRLESDGHHPWIHFIKNGGLCLVSGENAKIKNYYAHKMATGAAKDSEIHQVSFSDEGRYSSYVEDRITKNYSENVAFEKQYMTELIHRVLGSGANVITVENVHDAFTARFCIELLNHGKIVFATVDTCAKEAIVPTFHDFLKNGQALRSVFSVPVLGAYYEVLNRGGAVVNGAHHGYGFLTVPA